MEERSELLYGEEAARHIAEIRDPVTRGLVNTAFVHLVKSAYMTGKTVPRGGFDLLFLVTALEGYFAEHGVLGRLLQGEKVGAWFEED